MNNKVTVISYKRKKDPIDVPVLAVRIAAVLAALGVFAVYAVSNIEKFKWYDFAMAFSALALFVLVFELSVPNILRTICGKDEPIVFEAGNRNKTAKRFLVIVLIALGLHVLTYVIGVLMYTLVQKGSLQNIPASYWKTAWMKSNTDAKHYINIAENGYQVDGDDKLLIVFFPMLPYCIRAFNLVFANSYVSATIINAIAVSLSAGMIYLTFLPLFGEKHSRAAAFIAILLPGAMFMNSPMTEPLFVLFSACGFYFIQKRRYVPAGIFTALAGFTRSLGVLLAVATALVGLGHVIGLIRQKKPVGKTVALLITGLVISTFGTLSYLYINYFLHGDPLKFFEYQWSNWHQKACPFFDSPRYFIEQAKNAYANKPETLYSLWIPQYIAIFGSLALMATKVKKLPSNYTVYFLLYFAVSVGCTWLLSSVRYLSAAIPLIAAFALIPRKKTGNIILFTVLSAAYLGYMLMYMQRLGIY